MIRKFDEQLVAEAKCYDPKNLIVASIVMTVTNLLFFLVCFKLLKENDIVYLKLAETENKYGNMYKDINLARSPWVKYFILLFLLRRITHSLIPTLFRDHDGLQ